jgi:hypothetical protein
VLGDFGEEVGLSDGRVAETGLDGAHAFPYSWNRNQLFEDRRIHGESALVGNADGSAGVSNISQGPGIGLKVRTRIPVVSRVAPYTAGGAPNNGAPQMFEGYEERV